MEDGALESSSEEGSSLDEPSWVSWFCMLRNHEFFCEVDPAFVQDRFNLYGLKEVVGPLYGEAMTMILGYAPTGLRRTQPAFRRSRKAYGGSLVELSAHTQNTRFPRSLSSPPSACFQT